MHKKRREPMEPLDSVLQTGYAKITLRDNLEDYTQMMLDCTKQSILDINMAFRDEVVQNIDVAGFVEAIHNLRAASSRLDIQHRAMSEELQDLGFRKIVSQDFSEMGVGRRD